MQLPSASSIRVFVPTTSTAIQGTGNAPGGAPPPTEKDGLPEVEESVWDRIADWLRRAPAVFLPVLDDHLDLDEPMQAPTK